MVNRTHYEVGRQTLTKHLGTSKTRYIRICLTKVIIICSIHNINSFKRAREIDDRDRKTEYYKEEIGIGKHPLLNAKLVPFSRNLPKSMVCGPLKRQIDHRLATHFHLAALPAQIAEVGQMEGRSQAKFLLKCVAVSEGRER